MFIYLFHLLFSFLFGLVSDAFSIFLFETQLAKVAHYFRVSDVTAIVSLHTAQFHSDISRELSGLCSQFYLGGFSFAIHPLGDLRACPGLSYRSTYTENTILPNVLKLETTQNHPQKNGSTEFPAICTMKY